MRQVQFSTNSESRFATFLNLKLQGNKFQSPKQEASTQVLAAIMQENKLSNGDYYADCKVANEVVSAKNRLDAKKLFDYWNRVTQEYQFN